MREDLFFKPKTINILFEMLGKENKFATEISKATGITFCYVEKLIKLFNKEGLISKEKRGRTILLNLTTRGFEIVNKLKLIERLYKEARNAKIVKR